MIATLAIATGIPPAALNAETPEMLATLADVVAKRARR
jgi:hypothetical protein